MLHKFPHYLQISHLLNAGRVIGPGAIRVFPFPSPLFFCRHSRFVTARQESAVSIHDHKLLVTGLVAVACVQEVLQGDWALRGANDVNLLPLGTTERFKEQNELLSFSAWLKSASTVT